MNHKAKFRTVEGETSRANRIAPKPPKTIDAANAEAVANQKARRDQPCMIFDEQAVKDYRARDKYADHHQVSGGGTYKKGDIFSE
jgi:hypothetical protein